MKYRMFFCDYCEDKVLESKDARESSLEDILRSMDCVLHIPRNFFGIIDEENNTDVIPSLIEQLDLEFNSWG